VAEKIFTYSIYTPNIDKLYIRLWGGEDRALSAGREARVIADRWSARL